MMDLQYLLSKLSQHKHLAGLGRELLQDILRYLHRIGLVMWYEEIKHLESTVFLQPTFLITMFKVTRLCFAFGGLWEKGAGRGVRVEREREMKSWT